MFDQLATQTEEMMHGFPVIALGLGFGRLKDQIFPRRIF